MDTESEQQPPPPPTLLPIVGETELTEADFANIWFSVPQIRRIRGILGVMLVFSLALFVINAVADGPIWAGLLQLFFVASIAWFALFGWRSRFVKQAAADHATGRVQFRFDEQGFSSDSAVRSHQLRWPGLPQHIETEGSFLIYTGSQSLLLVPKRAFAPATWLRCARCFSSAFPASRSRASGRDCC